MFARKQVFDYEKTFLNIFEWSLIRSYEAKRQTDTTYKLCNINSVIKMEFQTFKTDINFFLKDWLKKMRSHAKKIPEDALTDSKVLTVFLIFFYF